MSELNATNNPLDQEPPAPPADATERERDEAAMAWLRWYHLHRVRGDNPPN